MENNYYICIENKKVSLIRKKKRIFTEWIELYIILQKWNIK